MLSRLPESRRARERRPAVLALSVAIHLGLGGLAVVGTLGAGEHDPAPPEALNPLHLPPSPDDSPARTTTPRRGDGAPRTTTTVEDLLPDVVEIAVGIPPLDLDAAPTPDDFRRGGGVSSALDDDPAGPGGGPAGGGPFSLSQVERAVIALPGAPAPRFPEMLRAAGVEGRVLARFVVDSTGRMEPSSFRILESPHELFSASVRDALARTRFAPAEAGGRRVRQLVEQAFVFAIER